MALSGYCDICGKKLYFGHCIYLTDHAAIEEQQRKGGKREGAGKKPKEEKEEAD